MTTDVANVNLLQPLRDYQGKAINDLRRTLSPRRRRVILQLPTGAGKTRIAAEITRLLTAKSHGQGHALFLAPRRELVTQAAARIERHGVTPGIIMAGESSDPERTVQVASFDTLHARAIRSSRIELPPADLVIVDECHLALAESRKQILAGYPTAWVIGLTATPARGDGRGLGEIFDAIVRGPSIKELVAAGHLVPLRYFAPSKPDLERMKFDRDGDYQAKELGHRMNSPALIGDIVVQWKRIAQGRSTVVYCVDRRHAENVLHAFLKAGVKAEELDATTPDKERKQILQRVNDGTTTVLVNIFIMSYGIDIPRLACAVLARPTRNITLYLQTLGRVMRTLDGKKDAIVIDHAGAIADNGFADEDIPWSLASKAPVKEMLRQHQELQETPKPIECPNCHAVFHGQRACPVCGTKVIADRDPIPMYQVDLKELRRQEEKLQRRRDRTYNVQRKHETYSTIKAYGDAHGYKSGWAFHSYREFFGAEPKSPNVIDAQPERVDEETWEWVHQRIVDYAKSKAKETG